MNEVREQNEILLTEQYDQLRDKLFGLSLKYQKSYCEAEDAVSETMVQVLEKFEQFEGKARLSTWVYSICIRKNLEILRRKKNYASKLKDNMRELWYHYRGTSTEFMPLQNDFRQALEELSEVERNVFVLTVYEDLSQKEIAEILEISVSNVKVILHRGRKKLMLKLKDYLGGEK